MENIRFNNIDNIRFKLIDNNKFLQWQKMFLPYRLLQVITVGGKNL